MMININCFTLILVVSFSYKDFDDMKEHMYFSGYDKAHPCCDSTNKQLLGKSKDEHDGNIFIQHIVLTPNMYCCETDDRKALTQGKGMDRKIVKHKIIIDDYLYTLTDNNKSYYTSDCDVLNNIKYFQLHKMKSD